jgi:hypothetical protein
MPDVMASMFGMMGMDCVLRFREERGWGAGLSAAFLLGAAVLCRASTVPLLLVAGLLLMPAGWKRMAPCLWPVAVACVLVAAFASLNRGAAERATVGAAFQLLTSMRNVPRNLVGFLCYQALTGPLLVYVLLSRGWKFACVAAGLVALGMALSVYATSAGGPASLVLYAMPAALSVCFLLACALLLGDCEAEPAVGDAAPSRMWARVRGVFRLAPPVAGSSLPLLVWLGAGLIALPYFHMAAKYLLPGVPAAALLVVRHAARVSQRRFPLVVALLMALGWISGTLIVIGDTTLASSQRDAVERLVVPRVHRGLKVWAGGQWAFLAYAEDAGARALANTPPLPGPGDYIVISRLDYYGAFDGLPFRRELLNRQPDRRCGVFVLNRGFHAGFYSIRFGYLPFAIGCGEVNSYDLYRVLP